MNFVHPPRRRSPGFALLVRVLLPAPPAWLADPASARIVGVHVNVSGNVPGALASNLRESGGLIVVTPGSADTQITFTAAIDSPHTSSSHSSGISSLSSEGGFARALILGAVALEALGAPRP